MAINVNVREADLSSGDDGTARVVFNLTTTNTSYPGEERKFSLAYPTTMTAAQIQAAINAAVTLLWQARGMPAWTV